jgi:hypothetical protein
MTCKREGCNKELGEPCYFANRLAVELGYCSYVCWLIDNEEACKKRMLEHTKRRET